MSEAILALRKHAFTIALLSSLDLIYEMFRVLARPTARVLHLLGITANQVTVARLFCSPITFYLLYSFLPSTQAYLAAVLFWGYSDAVDGVMSAEFENKPKDDVGVLLDSGADKSMTASMYGYHYGNFPHIVVVTIISEALLASLSFGSVVYAVLSGQDTRQFIGKIRASYWGKFKLALEITSAILMAFYTSLQSPAIVMVIYISASTAVLLLTMSLLTKVKKVLG